MKVKKILFLFVVLFSTKICAETKTEIYQIPLGSLKEISSQSDIEKLKTNIKRMTPVKSFKTVSKDKMIQHKNIKIFLEDTSSTKENYNTLIEVISDLAKDIEELDQEVVKTTLNRLKAQ